MTLSQINRVILQGNLTADPENRTTNGGIPICDLRVASNRKYKDKDGTLHEETVYADVTTWKSQAESCARFLRKGSSVLIEGRLKLDTWQDRTTGENRQKLKIEAESVQFLDRRPDRA